MTLKNWWATIDIYHRNQGTQSHGYILNEMFTAEAMQLSE